MNYSDKYIMSIYDNYTKINFSRESDDITVQVGHNNPWIHNDLPYFWWVTNHPLWARGSDPANITDIFKMKCKIRVLFLAWTTSEFDRIALENMECDVTTLKVVRDDTQWYTPTEKSSKALNGVQTLKMGYSTMSESSELNSYEVTIISGYLSACKSLEIFWIWGFTLGTVFKSFHNCPKKLYNFKYSHNSYIISGIKLDLCSLDINLKPGYLLLNIHGLHYYWKFSEESHISLKLSEGKDILKQTWAIIDWLPDYEQFSGTNLISEDFIFVTDFQLISLTGDVEIIWLNPDCNNPDE